jgi:hypothetical protein
MSLSRSTARLPVDAGFVLAHRMPHEGMRWKRSTCYERSWRGVATSRHPTDEFTLRAFANAVNLSDCSDYVKLGNATSRDPQPTSTIRLRKPYRPRIVDVQSLSHVIPPSLENCSTPVRHRVPSV